MKTNEESVETPPTSRSYRPHGEPAQVRVESDVEHDVDLQLLHVASADAATVEDVDPPPVVTNVVTKVYPRRDARA
ncbi:MAG: hypothetical protein U0169_20605 [Polyangiaceae bacterium]